MADNRDIEAAMAQLDIPSSASFSKPSRFRPKLRGANAAATAAKIGSVPPVLLPTSSSSSSSSSNTNIQIEPDTDPKAEAHDEVEREIDVFLAPFPLDDNETEIYVMQYALRPNWQTYEMEKRSTEVRVMPKCKKMEVDLRIDDDHRTFDAELARTLGIHKRTLRSVVAPSATDYAVGILRNNQIHLNPINGIVQLRPVIRSDQQKRKRTTHQMGPERNAKTEPVDSIQSEDEDESWVQLQFLPDCSGLSEQYQKKMFKTEHRKIEFTMAQSEYMGAICPKKSINHREIKEAIIRELESLPLQERLKKWFTEVSQLNRFDFIETILAPAEPVEEVLKQVQMLADLIHGVWVTKTSLLYEGDEATVRDYILLQFTKHDSIPSETLIGDLGQYLESKARDLRPLLTNLILPKSKKESNVKFKGLPDPTFSKRHKEVAEMQGEAWLAREGGIMARVRELNKIGVLGTRRCVVVKEDKRKKCS